MNAIILAAGRGSRLGQLRRFKTKPALPILGKPLVIRVFELISEWVDEVTVVVDPEVDDDIEWAGRLPTFVTQPEPLGSADALLAACAQSEGPWVVSACDNLVPSAHMRLFIREFETTKPDALIASRKITPADRPPGSVIQLDQSGTVMNIIEKPGASGYDAEMTALPLYGFQSTIIKELEDLERSNRGEFEIPGAIQNLIQKGGVVRAMEVPERLTVNDPSEYAGVVDSMLADLGEVQIDPGSTVAASATLKPPCYIEEGCRVSEEAEIGPYAYLIAGSEVGRRAVVRHAIVFEQARVPAGHIVEEKIFLPRGFEPIGLRRSRSNPDQAHHPSNGRSVG